MKFDYHIDKWAEYLKIKSQTQDVAPGVTIPVPDWYFDADKEWGNGGCIFICDPRKTTMEE